MPSKRDVPPRIVLQSATSLHSEISDSNASDEDFGTSLSPQITPDNPFYSEYEPGNSVPRNRKSPRISMESSLEDPDELFNSNLSVDLNRRNSIHTLESLGSIASANQTSTNVNADNSRLDNRLSIFGSDEDNEDDERIEEKFLNKLDKSFYSRNRSKLKLKSKSKSKSTISNRKSPPTLKLEIPDNQITNKSILSPTIPISPLSNNHSFTSSLTQTKIKVTDDDLNDLDDALNDALYSALKPNELRKRSKTAVTEAGASTTSFQRDDLELGLNAAPTTEFIPLEDLTLNGNTKNNLFSSNDAIITNSDNTNINNILGTENTPVAPKTGTFRQALEDISKNINVDEDTLSDESDAESDIESLLSGIRNIDDSENQNEYTPSAEIKQKQLPLFGKSLFLFNSKSKIRRWCYLTSKHPLVHLPISIMLFTQVSLLSYQQFKHENGYVFNHGYTWVDWVLAIFYFVYTLEFFIKCIAFGLYDDSQMYKALKLRVHENLLDRYKRILISGFIKGEFLSPRGFVKLFQKKNIDHSYIVDDETQEENITQREQLIEGYMWSSSKRKMDAHRAFLRNDWNIMDLVSIGAFWISFFLSFKQSDIGTCQVFRSLMCLKILRLLNYTKSSRKILRGIKDALGQSSNVITFLICFWLFMAIIGVESFKSSFRRQCFWTNPNNSTDTYLNEFQFCGSYLDPTTKNVMPYLNSAGISSGIIKGFTCPVNSKCVTGDNPYDGSVSFDNIFNSLELVFVIISANTFTDLMYYTMDSDSMLSSLFFILSIFLLVVWLLNLVIAVIIHSYTELAEKEKETASNETFWQKISREHNLFFQKSKWVKRFSKINSLFVLIIAINFIFDTTKDATMSLDRLTKFNNFDFSVSVILLFEIILRFVAYCLDHEPSAFFKSAFNCIDLALAFINIFISAPSIYKGMGQIVYGWLSFFLIARVYRVIYWFAYLRAAWTIVVSRGLILIQMVWFSILLMFLSAVIMSRLFEGIVPAVEDTEDPWTMYNLPNCFISLYIITSTENWTSILYTTKQYAKNTFTQVCISIYLLGWFFISNTVLLSIFIAVITEGMELTRTEKARSQLEKFIKDCALMMKNPEEKGIVDLVRAKLEKSSEKFDAVELLKHVNRLLVNLGQSPIDPNDYEKVPLITKIKKNKKVSFVLNFVNAVKRFTHLRFSKFKTKFLKKVQRGNTDLPQLEAEDPFWDPDENLEENTNAMLISGLLKKKKIDRSLRIFSNDNPIRRFFQTLTSPPAGVRKGGAQPIAIRKIIFNVTFFIISIVVVIFACYTTPLYRISHDKTNSYKFYTFYVDIGFVFLFTLEFIIKAVADGLFFGPTAYVKSIWNIIDFIVLLSFWVMTCSVFFGTVSSVVTFSALQAFRAFRLLTITKESQWNFETTMITGSSQIITAASISMSLLLPFSLWGLNIFSGRLSYCMDGVSSTTDCSLEFSNNVYNWDVYSPNYVETPYLNFDGFSNSMQSLFEIISLEGWTDLLNNVMSINGENGQPSPFSSPFNGIFVVIFNFCSIVFILNFFVSIVISNYAKKTGTAFLSDVQNSWYEVKKVLIKVKPSKRQNTENMNHIKKTIYAFLMKKNGICDKLLSLLFLIHFLLLVTDFYPFSGIGDIVRHGFFVLTTFGLLLHMILLLYVLGVRMFIANRWNIFRLIVLFIAFTFNCILFAVGTQNAYLNVDKAVLVCVLLFVIPRVDTLNQLLKFGSSGVTPLFWLIYTWLVLFIVFAIALNQLFGVTRLGANTNGNLNARTVTKAFIMLFRSSFGEGWNYTMTDFTIQEPYCFNGGAGNSDCGNKSIAMLLFISWNIISMYIFLNILLSVVINNFSYVYHAKGQHKLLTREELRKFKQKWNDLDPQGSGWIELDSLPKFLNSLDGVLSFRTYPKEFCIKELTQLWVEGAPYKETLDFNKLEEYFSLIDFQSIKERKTRYNKMCVEIEETAEQRIIDNTPFLMINFKTVLLAIGFFSRFENSDCLNIADRIKYNYNSRRIQRVIRIQKNIAAAKTVYTRLRWKHAEKEGLLNKIANTVGEENRLLREKFICQLKGKDVGYWKLLGVSEEELAMKVGGGQTGELERVSSRVSRNPFSDAYEL